MLTRDDSPDRRPAPMTGRETTRAELLDEVLAAFRSPTYTPPMVPATAIELLALARRPEVRFDEIARICERDPMVAARVVRVAQSAYFTRGARVSTLADAIVRVGVSTLAQIFIEATMTTRVFRAPGYDAQMASLRRHSTITAHVARSVANAARVNGEQAFLCGLLHDLGMAAAAFVVGTRVPFELAWSVIVDVHAEAGRIVCKAWNLPRDVELVVGTHHLGRTVTSSPLSSVVTVAEWVTAELGYGMDREIPRSRPEVELRMLGIDLARLDRITDEARTAAAQLV